MFALIKWIIKKCLSFPSRPTFIFGWWNQWHFSPRVRIGSTTYVTYPSRLHLADDVFIGQYSFIESSQGISIGTGSQIGYYVTLSTHSSHMAIRIYGEKFFEQKNPVEYFRGKIEIGSYCFVGPYCTIMPGTKLGKGCLVSAYSYVRGDFPDFSILAGNPAKVVGDTRTLDKKALEKNPELQEFYDAWAK